VEKRTEHNPTGAWAEAIVLTPKMAEMFLARNLSNRPESKRYLDRLSRKIAAGQWVLNGEAIKLDVDGNHRDGQHRCAAVIRTGVSIPTFLFHNLPREAFETLDQGRRRSVADIFHIDGEKNCIRLQSSIGWIARRDRNMWQTPPRLDYPEARDILHDNPALRQYMTDAITTRLDTLMPPGLSSALRYMTALVSDLESAQFWSNVGTGTNLQVGEAALLLRNTLLANKLSHRDKMQYWMIAALCIKAWNARGKENTPMRYLRFRVVGPAPESFPEIK